MRGVLSTVRDSVRTQLWPLPLVAVLIALLAGVLLPRLDMHVDSSLPGWASDVLFGGDAGAARTVLDAVSSSLITVTSLTFSLTVVTLQLASSQFSPRLLRTFTSDVFVQATLGLFLATFVYALTVLRTVRSGSTDGSSVPKISVTCSFLLAVASVIGLVLFLAHLARQIRVETMLRQVHEDASDTIDVVLGVTSDAGNGALPLAPDVATVLLAPRSGFVVRFDEQAVLAAALDTGATVLLDCCPGSSLVAGTPIGRAWSEHGRLDRDALDRLRHCLVGAVVIGFERTAAQDLGYGLRQLTDVANKALSPGINDPTTAAHALGHIAALLCDLSELDLTPRRLCDHDGRIRVVLGRPDFAELVDVALTQPRRYGSSDPQVMGRLFLALAQLAYRAPAKHHHIVAGQLARLETTVGGADFDDTERRQLAEAADGVHAALDRRRDDTGGR